MIKKTPVTYLLIFSDSNVFLDSQRPVDVQGVLVQRQHEDNEDKESVKNREEEHTLVSKFLQIVLDFRLEQKQVKLCSDNFTKPYQYIFMLIK